MTSEEIVKLIEDEEERVSSVKIFYRRKHKSWQVTFYLQHRECYVSGEEDHTLEEAFANTVKRAKKFIGQ